MKFIKKITLIIALVTITSLSCFSVQQSYIPWSGVHNYTATFYASGLGYCTYQISCARTDEELQCYANECYADFISRLQAYNN